MIQSDSQNFLFIPSALSASSAISAVILLARSIR